jgi:hypothetical protein
MAQKDPGTRDVVLWLPWCDGDCRCARPHRTRRTAEPLEELVLRMRREL